MNTEPRFMYLNNRYGARVACVAWNIVGARMIVAFSTHNPLDRFDNDEGKNKAIFRLGGENCKYRISCIIEEDDRIIPSIVLMLSSGNTFWTANAKQQWQIPQRTKEAARLWLKKGEVKLTSEQAKAKASALISDTTSTS